MNAIAKPRWAYVAVLVTAVSLGGCAGDGVEFNGKIFDAVGLSSIGSKREEPRTQARAPLVLPPEGTRLPEPGSAPVPVAADQAWPRDPQQQKLAEAEAKKRQQQEWCRDGNWKEKAMRDDAKAAHGPQGKCGSIFDLVGNPFGGSD
jgi:hypothetical protein